MLLVFWMKVPQLFLMFLTLGAFYFFSMSTKIGYGYIMTEESNFGARMGGN